MLAIQVSGHLNWPRKSQPERELHLQRHQLTRMDYLARCGWRNKSATIAIGGQRDGPSLPGVSNRARADELVGFVQILPLRVNTHAAPSRR